MGHSAAACFAARRAMAAASLAGSATSWVRGGGAREITRSMVPPTSLRDPSIGAGSVLSWILFMFAARPAGRPGSVTLNRGVPTIGRRAAISQSVPEGTAGQRYNPNPFSGSPVTAMDVAVNFEVCPSCPFDAIGR